MTNFREILKRKKKEAIVFRAVSSRWGSRTFERQVKCERNSDGRVPPRLPSRRNCTEKRGSCTCIRASTDEFVRECSSVPVRAISWWATSLPTARWRKVHSPLVAAGSHPSIILPLALTRDGYWKARVALWDLLLPSFYGVICFDAANSAGASQPSDRPDDRTNEHTKKTGIGTETERERRGERERERDSIPALAD